MTLTIALPQHCWDSVAIRVFLLPLLVVVCVLLLSKVRLLIQIPDFQFAVPLGQSCHTQPGRFMGHAPLLPHRFIVHPQFLETVRHLSAPQAPALRSEMIDRSFSDSADQQIRNLDSSMDLDLIPLRS